MTSDSDLLEKIKRLPARQQALVKSLVDELARTGSPQNGTHGQDWYGSLEHLGADITEEEIAQAREEMWGNFPREIDL